MSLITKSNPVGIDKKIDVFQKILYSSLIKTWGISGAKYNCTPRCYRNQSKDGYIAEMFTGGIANGNDYTELYIDDTVSATSFFGIGQEEKITADNMMCADVHLIFSVNLKEIKPLPTGQRNDEEVRIDVQSIIDHNGTAYGIFLTKQTIGIDKILNEYPGTRRDAGLKYKDMHPNYWFRFDMQIFYQPTTIICQ